MSEPDAGDRVAFPLLGPPVGPAQYSRLAESACTLEALTTAWARLGHPVPVAILTSIFDDLFATTGRHGPSSSTPLRMDDVFVDVTGIAQIPRRAGLLRLDAVLDLFVRALSTGPGEDLVPPAGRALVARFESEQAHDRPRDGEEARTWMRDALGPPAQHDEVARAFTVVHAFMSRLEVERPPPRPSAVLVVDSTSDFLLADVVREGPTDITAASDALGLNDTVIEPASSLPQLEPASTVAAWSEPRSSDVPVPLPVLSDAPPPSSEVLAASSEVAPGTFDVPRSSSDVPRSSSDVPRSSSDVPWVTSDAPRSSSDIPGSESDPPRAADGRPVIRHKLPKPSVRLSSAPAARQSAKPSLGPRDPLAIPNERPRIAAWLFVFALIVIGALFWLRYL